MKELNENIKTLIGAIEELTKVMDSVYNRQTELIDTWPSLSDEMNKMSNRLEKLTEKLK